MRCCCACLILSRTCRISCWIAVLSPGTAADNLAGPPCTRTANGDNHQTNQADTVIVVHLLVQGATDNDGRRNETRKAMVTVDREDNGKCQEHTEHRTVVNMIGQTPHTSPSLDCLRPSNRGPPNTVTGFRAGVLCYDFGQG